MPPFDIDLFGSAKSGAFNAPALPARPGTGAFGTIGAGLLDLSQLIASRGLKAGGNLQALNEQDLAREKLGLIEKQIEISRAKADHDQFMDLLKLPGPQRNAVLPSYLKRWGVDVQSDQGKGIMALWKSIGDEEASVLGEVAAKTQISPRLLATLPMEQQVKLLGQIMAEKRKTTEALKQKGLLETPEGGVSPLPGFAEAEAEKAGLIDAAKPRKPTDEMTRSQAFELGAMGVKDLMAATPEQKEEAIRRIQKRQIDVAAAQSGARVEAAEKQKRQEPIGLKSTDYVHPDTFQAPPAEATLGEIQKGGYVKITAKQKETIQGFGNVANIVQQVDSLSKRIIVAENFVDAQKQGISLFAGAKSKSNALAATYEGTRGAFTGVLSRTLGGERGVLTDRDITRIVQMLPAFNDTKAVRDLKVALVEETIRVAVATQRSIITGKMDLSSARSQNEKIIESAITKAETAAGGGKSGASGMSDADLKKSLGF